MYCFCIDVEKFAQVLLKAQSLFFDKNFLSVLTRVQGHKSPPSWACWLTNDQVGGISSELLEGFKGFLVAYQLTIGLMLGQNDCAARGLTRDEIYLAATPLLFAGCWI